MLPRFAFVCLLLAAAACSTTQTGGPGFGPQGLFGGAQPQTAWDSAPQGHDWTAAARAAIDSAGPGLTAGAPKDIAAYCPRWASADPQARRDFWVVMLSQIAKTESGLDPAKIGPGGARGLLQISADAAKRYGCAIAGEQDLLDPTQNIACGAKILAATSGQDGYVAGYAEGWRGASRYWIELRKPDFVADLQNVLNAQSFCARGTS